MTLVQRRLLSLMMLVGLAFAGAGLVYWQQQKGERDVEAKQAADKLLALDNLAPVAMITLVTPHTTFELHRRTEGNERVWRLTAPLETSADRVVVDGILEHLIGLRRTREVGEPQPDGSITPPADLKLFELDPAPFRITVTLDDGSHETLEVGKKSSFDGSIFVRVTGKPTISLVPGALFYQVDQELFKLRDKKLVPFETNDMQKLSVQYSPDRKGLEHYHYTLTKVDGSWSVTEPELGPADEGLVLGILGGLAGARAKHFEAEHATLPVLEKTGLAKPSATVEITTTAGDLVTVTLAQDPNQSLASTFGLRSGAFPVLELNSEGLVKKLRVRADELLDKRVVRFERNAVLEIRMSRGEQSLTLVKERDIEKGLDTWKLTTPEARPVEDPPVAGLLYRLGNLKGVQVVAQALPEAERNKFGLDKPELTATLLGEAQKVLATLMVSAAKDGVRYGLDVASGRVLSIVPQNVDDLSANPADYREPAAAAKE